MICPDCGGSGRIGKRFLLLFTRHARCSKCLGTGQFPPPVREVVRSRTRYRDDDDRWPAPGFGSTTSDSRAARDDDRFEVGSGGRSGGAGGGASWGESGGSEPPVIADPFAGGSSSSVGSVAAADASDSGSSGSGDSATSDSGTSY